MTESLQLFFPLLAIVAIVLAVSSFGALLLRGRLRAAAWYLGALGPVALWLAAAVAVTATAGSLYFSEVAGYPPCELCWYQRIAMYPLAVVLPVAAIRGDRGVAWYAYPLAGIGAGIATWHRYVELNPDSGGSCSATVPCSTIWFETFGVFTLPVLAGCGFVAIAALVSVARHRA